MNEVQANIFSCSIHCPVCSTPLHAWHVNRNWSGDMGLMPYENRLCKDFVFTPSCPELWNGQRLHSCFIAQSEKSGVNILMQKRQTCKSHFFNQPFHLLIIPPLLISLSPSVSFFVSKPEHSEKLRLSFSREHRHEGFVFSSLLSQMSPQERSVCLKQSRKEKVKLIFGNLFVPHFKMSAK